MKAVTKIVTGNTLATTFDSAIVELDDCVRISLAALITDAPGSTSAPTSAPVGTWSLWFSYDRVEFFPIPTVDDVDVATAMGRMNAAGNAVVRAGAVLPAPPGLFIRAHYECGSGGGAGANCELWLEVER